MRRLSRRVYYLLHRRRLERELEEEMAAHREALPAEKQPTFGDVWRLKEQSRDQWGWTWLDDLQRDLAYGARGLLRSPGFTLTAISVLALGIGVNLAEVQVLRVAFSNQTFRDARSVRIFERILKDGQRQGFPVPAVELVNSYSRGLSAMVEVRDGPVLLEGDATELRALFVSGNYFPALSLKAAFGRLLDEHDCQPGAPPAAVIGYDLWRGRFGADASITNRTVRMNGRSVQIVGVAPYEFTGLATGNFPVWLPITTASFLMQGNIGYESWDRGYDLYGKLRPGVSPQAAEAELLSLTEAIAKQHPDHWDASERIVSKPLNAPQSDPGFQAALAMGALLLVLVLLSACANLGNMLLARGMGRRREIDIRLAIGATRSRLVRQLLTESLLLATLAACAALFLSNVFVRWLLHLVGFDRLWPYVSADGGLLLTSLGSIVVSTLAFGLPPAIQTVRQGPASSRARAWLVGIQVAVSCLLLILAGTLTHGALRYSKPSLAFDYGHIVSVDPTLYAHNQRGAVAHQTLRDITTRLARLPGVDHIGLADSAPFDGRIWVERVAGSKVESPQQLFLTNVDGAYFSAMALPILRGRTFLADDGNAAIVGESAARGLWPNEDALGKTLEIGRRKRTVVGVVKDGGLSLLTIPGSVEVYLPLEDRGMESAKVMVHTTGDALALLAASNSAASQPGLQCLSTALVRELERIGDDRKVFSTGVGFVSGIATVLSAVGIFGMVAFTVAQRTKEIGIRMALGARARNVFGVVLGHYAVPVGVGAAAGVAMACGAAQIARRTIIGMPAFDAAGYIEGIAIFIAIAAIASLLPAHRALSIEPSAALRED